MERMQKVVVDAADQSFEINDLPDDVLAEIVSRLSRMNRREAVRTSILSRKWRYLPSFRSSVPVTLVLDHRVLLTRSSTNLRAQFKEWVDRVMGLHHDVSLDGLIIRAPYLHSMYSDAENWVNLAVLRGVKVFELECDTEFSDADMIMLPHDLDSKFAFVSLSFVGVNVGDDVIHDFLKRCPHLEKLCIRRGSRIKDLKVIDSPRLKVLEISDCNDAQRLEISVPSLVSCTYGGDKVLFPFKDNPNLCELTLRGNVARSFVYEPKKHASYSDQLVKLELSFLKMFQPSNSKFPDLPRLCSLKHLILDLVLPVGKSIHFFIKFIGGSPLLKELTIKVSYMVKNPQSNEKLGFPEESPSSNLGRGHKNLKVVKMSGYVGCSTDDKFILRLLNIAQSLKTVAIDTESEYYNQKPWDCATQCPNKDRKGLCGFCSVLDIGARTRVEAKRRANQLKSSFPPKTKAVLIVT